MGLDVYLHRQDGDPVAIEKLESASAAYSEEQYSLMARGRAYAIIPKEDLDSWRDKCKQYNKEHGLDKDGVAPGRERIDEPSSLRPPSRSAGRAKRVCGWRSKAPCPDRSRTCAKPSGCRCCR